MSDPSLSLRVLRAADRRAASRVRAWRSFRGHRVRSEELTLSSTAGYRLRSWIHLPERTPAPAVVLCPGIDDSGAVFSNMKSPITADEVAQAGFVALRFDPAGRGDSWGEEDFGGPEHQDNVDVALRYLASREDVDADRVGILSVSLGVAMAVGAAARLKTPAAWVLDWEGPCDREIITAQGTIMAPANGHSLDDEDYWKPREAVQHVASMTCPYIRLQSEWDHAQPGELRHALRMIQAAEEGELPWFQINAHPRGQLPPRVIWLASGQLAANRAILAKLAGLHSTRRS